MDFYKYVLLIKLDLEIEGMICVFCVLRVEKVFKVIFGVIEVFVNLVMEKVCISFDGNLIFKEDFLKVVVKVGYMVKFWVELKVLYSCGYDYMMMDEEVGDKIIVFYK